MSQNIVLVHGAFHDASFFAPLIRALSPRGVEAVAVDLPGHGARRPETATLASYTEAVFEALQRFDSPPLLLGHSMGGVVVSAAAEAAPERVAALIYLCAFRPVDGETLMSLTQRGPEIEGMAIDPAAGSATMPAAVAERIFYHDCPDAAHWAARIQSQALAPAVVPLRLTAARSGRVPYLYVRCMNDRMIPSALQTEMAMRGTPVEVVDLACGHSPFIACPEALADVLVSAASSLGRMPQQPA